MKKLFQIITFCLSAIIIPACAGKADTKFTNLSADEFERLINDSEVQCVDVRTATEYSEEHIAGSLNINVLDQHFLDDAEKQLEHNRPVAVYCRSGRRSRKAIPSSIWTKDLKDGRKQGKTRRNNTRH